MMDNKEFVLEAIQRLLPDTSWHGESTHDGKSVKNIGIMREVLFKVLDNITCDSVVANGYKGNGSFETIAKAKQEIIKELFWFFAEFDLDEVIEHFKSLKGKEELTIEDLKTSHDLLKPLGLIFENA